MIVTAAAEKADRIAGKAIAAGQLGDVLLQLHLRERLRHRRAAA